MFDAACEFSPGFVLYDEHRNFGGDCPREPGLMNQPPCCEGVSDYAIVALGVLGDDGRAEQRDLALNLFGVNVICKMLRI